MITLTDVNNKIHEVKVIQFSDGALNVELDEQLPIIKSINWLVDNVASEMVQLMYVVEALELLGQELPKTLYLPYLPNARADRVFKKGNANPLDNFMRYLTIFEFEEITCYDVHSEKALELAEKFHLPLKSQPQFSVLVSCFKHRLRGTMLVAPDKGASEKTKRLSEWTGNAMIQVTKHRSLDTGRIVSVEVPEGDYSGKTFTIIDDICDGGGTFIPIAKQLKEMGASEVNLCVTHGIFSKGLDIFKDCVDNVYVANIVGEYITTHCIQKFNLRKGK